MIKQSLVPDFINLFSKISSIISTSGDVFLIETGNQQLEHLLKSFINFLRVKDIKLQEFNFQLSNIATMLSIFSYLKKISYPQTLDIERDILVFRKSLLNLKEVNSNKKPIVIHKTDYFTAPKSNSILNHIQKKILGFIEGGDEILNIEIFNHFKNISKRTLKRHLSQLISSGYINREAQGKKVYYKKSAIVSRQVNNDGN